MRPGGGATWRLASALAVLTAAGRTFLWADIPISPPAIAGLGLWLDAAELAPGLKAGAPVLRWPDQSGNGYDAIFEPRIPQADLQTGRHQPPTFEPDAWSTHPAVSFDAFKRQSLVLNYAGHALGQNAPGFAAAFVVRAALAYGPPPPDVEWSPIRYLFISHLSNYSTRFAVEIEANTGYVRVQSRFRPPEALSTFPSPADPHRFALRAHAWHRLIVSVDYRKKRGEIMLDGLSSSHRLNQIGDGLSENIPGPIVGIASNTLGDWLSCDLAELLCYQKTLSAGDLRRLDAYLRAKYPFTD